MRSIENLQAEIRHLSSVETIFKWITSSLVISSTLLSIQELSIVIFLVGVISAAITGGIWLESASRRKRIEEEIKEREWG
jgi:hypothetical protein